MSLNYNPSSGPGEGGSQASCLPHKPVLIKRLSLDNNLLSRRRPEWHKNITIKKAMTAKPPGDLLTPSDSSCSSSSRLSRRQENFMRKKRNTGSSTGSFSENSAHSECSTRRNLSSRQSKFLENRSSRLSEGLSSGATSRRDSFNAPYKAGQDQDQRERSYSLTEKSVLNSMVDDKSVHSIKDIPSLEIMGCLAEVPNESVDSPDEDSPKFVSTNNQSKWKLKKLKSKLKIMLAFYKSTEKMNKENIENNDNKSKTKIFYLPWKRKGSSPLSSTPTPESNESDERSRSKPIKIPTDPSIILRHISSNSEKSNDVDKVLDCADINVINSGSISRSLRNQWQEDHPVRKQTAVKTVPFTLRFYGSNCSSRSDGSVNDTGAFQNPVDAIDSASISKNLRNKWNNKLPGPSISGVHSTRSCTAAS